MATAIRITTSLFNYKEILPLLADKGRQVFGPHFRIYPEDLKVIIPIIGWMLRDEDVAQQFEIDLNKGIFLGGPVGTGKTQIMKLMTYIAPNPREHKMTNCINICNDYCAKGPATLDQYNHGANIWCFDDLGREDQAQYYGNTCYVMKNIILNRYEQFTHNGIITHMNSSLTTLEIENKYGVEVRSRMREMFNRIVFDRKARDKREISIPQLSKV
jgi:energy-coupling factor transporter ATP-binding protein EcfA2